MRKAGKEGEIINILKKLKLELAGKTGTTNESKDLWF